MRQNEKKLIFHQHDDEWNDRHSLSLFISQQECSIERLQNNDSLVKHKWFFQTTSHEFSITIV